MSIAIASLLILVLIAVIAVPIIVRAVGTAGRRNKNRPDDSSDREEGGISDEGRPSDGEMHREEEAMKSLGPLFGGLVAVAGLLTGLVGGIFGVWQFTVGDAVPAASMGIFLGLVGYFLGARGLGKAAAIVSMAAIIFAMAVGQGYVPGLNATDRGLPRWSRARPPTREPFPRRLPVRVTRRPAGSPTSRPPYAAPKNGRENGLATQGRASRSPRRPQAAWWMVTREVEGRTEMLTVAGNNGEALAVFSDEGEAEMFVWVGERAGAGWRPMEGCAVDVLSALHGPCAGTRTVALDPSPELLAPETLALACLDRERFAQCLTAGGRPRLSP